MLAASLGAVLPALVHRAHADVLGHDLFFARYYTQNDEWTPSDPWGHYGTLNLYTADASDFDSVSVELPDESLLLLTDYGTTFQNSRFFNSDEEMFEALPSGLYWFYCDGGTLGAQAYFLERVPEVYWPDAVPTFTPETFQGMQSVNAGADFVLEFNGWSAPPPADSLSAFVYMYEYESGEFVMISYLEPWMTSYTMPAGTLKPGTRYSVYLTFSARIQEFDRVIPRLVAYDHSTYSELLTVDGCVGDLNGDNLVDDSDFVIFVEAYNLLDCADPAMPLNCPADLNRDDLVDDSDFVIFVGAYNELICP